MNKCIREACGAPRCVDWCREPQDCIARPLISELLFEKGLCPICHGDCAGANPPMAYCPMKDR